MLEEKASCNLNRAGKKILHITIEISSRSSAPNLSQSKQFLDSFVRILDETYTKEKKSQLIVNLSIKRSSHASFRPLARRRRRRRRRQGGLVSIYFVTSEPCPCNLHNLINRKSARRAKRRDEERKRDAEGSWGVNKGNARGLIRRLRGHGSRTHSMVVNRLEIRPVNFVNSTPTKKRDRQDLIYIYIDI